VSLELKEGRRLFSTHQLKGTPEIAQLCCSGEIHSNAGVQQPAVVIERILSQSTTLDHHQIEKFYSFVKDFRMGPMLRIIESAHVHRDSTLVLKVSLTGKQQKGTVPRFLFDPLLLNACYFLLDSTGVQREKILIPIFIENLTVFRPMTETAYVVNTLRVQRKDYISFDAMVFTETGECIATMPP
jgi:hypothetical protein